MSSNSIKQHIQETTPLLANGHILTNGSNGIQSSEAVVIKDCCAKVSDNKHFDLHSQ